MRIEEFVLNVAVSAVLGAAIGFEREIHQRKAGLRTNVLVALGSAAFVTVGAFVPHEDSQSRVAAAVVSGVGFLGAGVIFKDGATIKGLDTAATVWCSAAVGALAGWGQLWAATFTTALVLLTNAFVRPFIKRIDRSSKSDTDLRRTYRITVVCTTDVPEIQDRVNKAVAASGMSLLGMERTRNPEGRAAGVRVVADVAGTSIYGSIVQLAGVFAEQPDVESVVWREVPAQERTE